MDETLSKNKLLLNEAVNQVMAESSNAADNIEGLLDKVAAKFLNMKLDCFPEMCDVARVQNRIKIDNLRALGARTGRHTDSLWSTDGNFMFDYDIPQELYVFMINFVYKDFWSNENAKVWRRFMKAICNRDASMTNYDAMNLLIKVKQIYGSNADLSLTR